MQQHGAILQGEILLSVKTFDDSWNHRLADTVTVDHSVVHTLNITAAGQNKNDWLEACSILGHCLSPFYPRTARFVFPRSACW